MQDSLTINKKDLYITRAVVPGDVNFIMATFLRGLYYGDSWFREIPKDIFMENYHAILERILSNPRTIIAVACLKEDQDVILGYSVYCNTFTGVNLHWVFVKNAWRGIGIGKSLVPSSTNVVTHLTKSGLGIIKKHKEIVFNPFAVN